MEKVSISAHPVLEFSLFKKKKTFYIHCLTSVVIIVTVDKIIAGFVFNVKLSVIYLKVETLPNSNRRGNASVRCS